MEQLFLSKYINILDKKGRVSVPSQYRAILNGEEFKGIVVYGSIRNKCVEACSIRRIYKIYEMISNLDPYSEERDAFETILLGGSSQLSFDKEGRVLIPDELTKYANLESEVCFVGKGDIFEIWNAKDFEAYCAQAKEKAIANRGILGAKTEASL